MSAWTVVNDASHQWATWTVYENGVRQGCFYHEHEAREWIKRHEFFKTRGYTSYSINSTIDPNAEPRTGTKSGTVSIGPRTNLNNLVRS